MVSVRPAAVAGSFYPAAPALLAEQVRACLAEVPPAAAAQPGRPKLLVVPHAGYIYSGPVAAAAYQRLRPWAAQIRRVVLLGPVHRVPVRGLAAPTVEAFETPLGRVPIDQAALAALADLPQVLRSDRAHAMEHALEVQLPFLQTVLAPGWRLLPLAVGDAAPQEVAEVVERLWGGDETLILLSSDLSHFLPYGEARRRDEGTVQRIAALATDLDPHDACGARVLNGALLAARRHGLRAERLALCNSGDTAGERSRVVGYAALAFAPGPAAAGAVDAAVDEDEQDAADAGAAAGAGAAGGAADAGHAADARGAGAAGNIAKTGDAAAAAAGEPALGAALLSRARNAIRRELGLPADEAEPPHPALQAPGATFVTLHDARGALRGCIGSLQAWRALEEDVRRNAEGAAFRDTRFRPLSRAEWQAGLQVEVSLLDAPQPLPPVQTEAQALALLKPGLDGLILNWHGHRATFLPQVWAQLPEPAAFLAALKRKAGLAEDFWAGDVELQRYGVRSFE